MGSLMKSSGVVTPTTLGNFVYLQISASIIENFILFHIVESMQDTVTKMVYIPILSRLMIMINTTWNH